MHFLNKLLPAEEKQFLGQDEAHSVKEIEIGIERLKNNEDSILDMKQVGIFLRLLRVHKSLKYRLEIELRRDCVLILKSVLDSKQMSTSVRCSILAALHDLISHSDRSIPGLFFEWKPMWQQALDTATRVNRHEAACVDTAVADLLSKQSKLMHTSREYFVRDSDSAAQKAAVGDEIVRTAMRLLADTRLPVCIEGVLLMVTCLPTQYAHYDQWLPAWVSTWCSIAHNPHWDCCWATLLARARKHTTAAFDWQPLAPLLKNKSFELMRLSAVGGGGQQVPRGGHGAGDFPRTFPGYYAHMLQINHDERKVALNKIAKIMYFIIIASPVADMAPAERISVTAPFGNAVASPDTSGGGMAATAAAVALAIPGFNADILAPNGVRRGAVDMMTYFQSLRPFFYPSNAGEWTADLGFFFGTFVFQVCRHVGRGLIRSLFAPAVGDTDAEGAAVHAEPPLELVTVRYIYGSCLSLILECMYGKNQTLAHFGSAALKNLFAIDPLLGEAVVPFLLQALDAAAVNQSHQAPVAMRTMSLCFKALLSPCPVVLPHLTTLLRLSLPGIDSSDPSKTCITLGMYTNILSWIPIGCKLRTEAVTVNRSYLALTDCSNAAEKELYKQELMAAFGSGIMDDSRRAALLDDIATFLVDEWGPSFLRNIFKVTDAAEARVKGSRPSAVIGSIAQCVGGFFNALRPHREAVPVRTAEGRDVRTEMENMLLDYLVRQSRPDCAKVSAKMADAMVAAHPERLESVLAAFFEVGCLATACASAEAAQQLVSDLVSHFAAEKLAFRLQLASGACRSAHGANILLHPPCRALLTALLTSRDIMNHTERSVRKAAAKLLKDALKGSTSFYPTQYAVGAVLPGDTAVTVGGSSLLRCPTAAANSALVHDALPDVDGSEGVAVVHWHAPSGAVLTRAVELLRATLSVSVAAVTNAVRMVVSSNDSGVYSGESGAKMREEELQAHLHRIAKCLRGAAEILGDDFSAASLSLELDAECLTYLKEQQASLEERAGEHGDIDREGDESEGNLVNGAEGSLASAVAGRRSRVLMSTGRAAVVQQALAAGELPAADARYLREIRSDVMHFLSLVHDALVVPDSSSDDGSSAAAASASPAASANAQASVQGHSFSNSSLIRSAWVKCYVLGVSRRTASMKNTEEVVKWLKYEKRNSRSSIVRIMYKHIKKQEVLTGQPIQPSTYVKQLMERDVTVLRMASREHWQGHDMTTLLVSSKAWALHVRRQQELSHVSMRKNTRSLSGATAVDQKRRDPYINALFRLVDLAAHEYDTIRSKASMGFSKVTTWYGVILLPVLRALLQRLLTRDTPYLRATAAASLCMHANCIKRITMHWDLNCMLLSVIYSPVTQLMINAVPEPDKREKLMNRVCVDLFLRWVTHWCHVPLKPGSADAHRVNDLLQGALAAVAAATTGRTAGAADEPNEVSAQSAGLRIETFAAYIVMHLIGHPHANAALPELALVGDDSSPTIAAVRHQLSLLPTQAVWHWCVAGVSNCAGHPMQSIAFQALIRMCGLLQQVQSHLAGEAEATGHFHVAVARLRPLLATRGVWANLLAGISQQRARVLAVGDDGGHGGGGAGGGSAESTAQWARGIGSALRGAKFLEFTYPRYFTNPTGEYAIFKSQFSSHSAAIFYSLTLTGVFEADAFFGDTSIGSSGNSDAPVTLSRLLSTAAALPHTSEQEIRANNLVRAELFSGALRALLELQRSGQVGAAAAAQGEASLLACVVEHTEKASLEYCNDWAQAIFFAYAGSGSAVDLNGSSSDAIASRLLADFKRVLSHTSAGSSGAATATAQTAVSAELSTDGFAAQSKALLLVEALLRSDITGVAARGASSRDSSDGNGSSSSDSSVAAALLQMLSPTADSSSGGPSVDIVCSYVTSRSEMASILAALHCATATVATGPNTQQQQLADVCARLCREAAAVTDEAVDDRTGIDSGAMELCESAVETASVSAVSSANAATQRSRNATELCCFWLREVAAENALWRCAELLPPLLSTVVRGAASAEPSLAAKCQGTCFLACKRLSDSAAVPPSASGSVLGPCGRSNGTVFAVSTALASQAGHESYTVRKTVMLALTAVLGTHLQSLDADSKKLFKDVFVKGLGDAKVEVQSLAMAGMVVYVANKTSSELKTLADAYVKNSEILLAREKKRKRQLVKDAAAAGTGTFAADHAAAKLDPMHQSTVMMMGTMVLAAPFDMPAYMPALLASFVRHATVSTLTPMVARIVQAFKRTHQDRWNEFQKQFSREQLDDLQGAGAQHYFA